MRSPNSKELLASLIEKAMAAGCHVEIYPIQHKAGVWHQVRIADTRTRTRQGIFLLTAGIHGTEVVGPLTIYRYFNQILEMTRNAGLQLVCYPLMNPSGFDNGTDRNIDNDGGDDGTGKPNGNNDYARVKLFDGRWTWNLGSQDHSYREWRWSSHPSLKQRLPAETLVMHRFLKKERWKDVKILADLHGDNLTKDAPAGTYYYSYGLLILDQPTQYAMVEPPRHRYSHITDRIRSLGEDKVKLLANYDFRFNRDNPDEIVRSDENGNIVFHDGTLSDLAYRLGVRHALTIETTGATDLAIAIGVNLIWIEELIKLGRLEK